MKTARMAKLDWDDIRIFLSVARTGSFNAAARALDSNQPTIGRHIDRLEQVLGTRLFLRHARGLTLTNDAHHLLDVAKNMEISAHDAIRINGVKGTVRISIPEGLATYVITPSLGALLNDNPHLSIELMVSSRYSNVSQGEADIAIRLNPPSASDMVGRKLGAMRFHLYGALSGCPKSRIITYGSSLEHLNENRWIVETFPNAAIAMSSDHTLSRVKACAGAIGMAVLPSFIGDRTPQLTRMPCDTPIPMGHEVWIVVHESLRNVHRIRVVMDFLTTTVQQALVPCD